jgi:MFS family permease
MEDLDQVGIYKFDSKVALGLFRKPSLLLLFAQGFVGVFPWQVITFWFFRYLEVERFYDSEAVLTTMAPAILVLAAGYFVGGALGDRLFQRTPRGRLIVSMFGVLVGAILFFITLNVPVDNQSQFMILMIITALFIPFASANVISTVYDVTLPEVRSTALSIQYFLENGGAALAPLIAGFIARSYSLHIAILTICISAWIVGSILLAFTAYIVPKDIQTLRDQMEERAELERSGEAPGLAAETA